MAEWDRDGIVPGDLNRYPSRSRKVKTPKGGRVLEGRRRQTGKRSSMLGILFESQCSMGVDYYYPGVTPTSEERLTCNEPPIRETEGRPGRRVVGFVGVGLYWVLTCPQTLLPVVVSEYLCHTSSLLGVPALLSRGRVHHRDLDFRPDGPGDALVPVQRWVLRTRHRGRYWCPIPPLVSEHPGGTSEETPCTTVVVRGRGERGGSDGDEGLECRRDSVHDVPPRVVPSTSPRTPLDSYHPRHLLRHPFRGRDEPVTGRNRRGEG